MLDPAAALANRVFERQAWAQERIKGHAGRVFVVAVGPLSAPLRVLDSGRLEGMPLAGTTPDLTLTVSPIGLPSFLANPARWAEFVTAAGDPALAATLQDLAQTLPWFVEETFADVLGPVVGQRIADAGRRLLAFPEYAAQRFSESVASYARDEAELVAGSGHLAGFTEGTAALATRVEALSARIDALATGVRGRAGAAAKGDGPGENVVTFPRG